MAKKNRETFQKREKEKARQQKRNEKQARRHEAKERRANQKQEVGEEDISGIGADSQLSLAEGMK